MTEPSATVGQWDRQYANLTAPEPYGDSPTYKMAAEFMDGLSSVEDWGCGKGWLRQRFDPAVYKGIDGSHSPFADVVDDLATRETKCEGIVLRHVLEHNWNWVDILNNAIKSATNRIIVVLFTPPLAKDTDPPEKLLQTEPEYGGVPVLSLNTTLIMHLMKGAANAQTFESPQGSYPYGVETVIRNWVSLSKAPV